MTDVAKIRSFFQSISYCFGCSLIVFGFMFLCGGFWWVGNLWRIIRELLNLPKFPVLVLNILLLRDITESWYSPF